MRCRNRLHAVGPPLLVSEVPFAASAQPFGGMSVSRADQARTDAYGGRTSTARGRGPPQQHGEGARPHDGGQRSGRRSRAGATRPRVPRPLGGRARLRRGRPARPGGAQRPGLRAHRVGRLGGGDLRADVPARARRRDPARAARRPASAPPGHDRLRSGACPARRADGPARNAAASPVRAAGRRRPARPAAHGRAGGPAARRRARSGVRGCARRPARDRPGGPGGRLRRRRAARRHAEPRGRTRPQRSVVRRVGAGRPVRGGAASGARRRRARPPGSPMVGRRPRRACAPCWATVAGACSSARPG